MHRRFFAPFRIGFRPFVNQTVQQCQLGFFGIGGGIGFQHIGQIAGQRGGFAQIAQTTDARKIGGFCLFCSEFHFVFEAAVQVVGRQQQIARLCSCAVCFGIAALLSQSVTVAEIFVYVFIGHIQRLDTQLFKDTQFIGLGNTVLIEILPYAQGLECGICRTDDTVAV